MKGKNLITVDGILDETAWLLPYSFAVKQEGVNSLVYPKAKRK